MRESSAHVMKSVCKIVGERTKQGTQRRAPNSKPVCEESVKHPRESVSHWGGPDFGLGCTHNVSAGGDSWRWRLRILVFARGGWIRWFRWLGKATFDEIVFRGSFPFTTVGIV